MNILNIFNPNLFEFDDFGPDYCNKSFEERLNLIGNTRFKDRDYLLRVYIEHIVRYGSEEEKIYWQQNYENCKNRIIDINYLRYESQTSNKDPGNYNWDDWKSISYNEISF